MRQEQKQNLATSVVHKSIFEIKKKIQLSEGQRKAAFEDCETERKNNVDEILKLKKEILKLVVQLNEIKYSKTNFIVHKKQIENIIGPYDEKTTEEVQNLLDLQKTDKLKLLDLLHYKIKRRQKLLRELGEEYEVLLSNRAKKQVIQQVDRPVKKVTRELQNSIHAVEVQLREANHIYFRYSDIKKSLQDDSARFESNISMIEEKLNVQSIDIKKLEEVANEASRMRAAVRGYLLHEEKAATSNANTRDRQMADGKRLLTSRKQELEMLEKRIFQGGKPTTRTEHEEVPEDAAPGTDDESPESPSQLGDVLADVFETLKQATGGTSSDEVLVRFNYQKETRTRLLVLRKRSENEKRKLEKHLEQLNLKLEHYRYDEVRDIERKSGEMEQLHDLIDVQRTRSSKYRSMRIEIEKSVKSILSGVEELYGCINPLTRPEKNALHTLGQIKIELQNILNQNDSNEIENNFEQKVLLDANDEKWLPAPYSGIVRKTPLPQQGSSPAPPPLPGPEDDEDVPSRAYLKRQAQLVVDAKSRRKNIRIHLHKN